MRVVAIVAVTGLLCGAPAASRAADQAKPVAIGAVVPDFTCRDVDGKEFRFSSVRTLKKEDALAATLAAARARGAATAAPTDLVDALPGIRGEDGAIDPRARCEFLNALGRTWGMLATEALAPRTKTLGEVATWLETASTVPIVFVVWSPSCPYVRAYDDRIQAAVAAAGARMYALSSNARVSEDDVRAYVRKHGSPYRVLVDPRQEVCDLLGGRNTPEAIVVDAQGMLRYRGGIDDDPLEDKKPEERSHWLKDTLAALREGRPVARPERTPVGSCPVRRK
jgi:peroxiredoxin